MTEQALKHYEVTIPYFTRFFVYAKNDKEALQKAHEEGNGSIMGYSDEQATVDEVEK